MKHTKGKWEVSKDKKQVYSNISDDPCRNFTIAKCDNEGITQEETEANAKLITAAPELLEALVKVRSRIQYEQGINKLNGIGKDWSLELKEINNAINKATL